MNDNMPLMLLCDPYKSGIGYIWETNVSCGFSCIKNAVEEFNQRIDRDSDHVSIFITSLGVIALTTLGVSFASAVSELLSNRVRRSINFSIPSQSNGMKVLYFFTTRGATAMALAVSIALCILTKTSQNATLANFHSLYSACLDACPKCCSYYVNMGSGYVSSCLPAGINCNFLHYFAAWFNRGVTVPGGIYNNAPNGITFFKIIPIISYALTYFPLLLRPFLKERKGTEDLTTNGGDLKISQLLLKEQSSNSTGSLSQEKLQNFSKTFSESLAHGARVERVATRCLTIFMAIFAAAAFAIIISQMLGNVTENVQEEINGIFNKSAQCISPYSGFPS